MYHLLAPYYYAWAAALIMLLILVPGLVWGIFRLFRDVEDEPRLLRGRVLVALLLGACMTGASHLLTLSGSLLGHYFAIVFRIPGLAALVAGVLYGVLSFFIRRKPPLLSPEDLESPQPPPPPPPRTTRD